MERETPQSRAIRRTLQNTGHPLSPREILAAAKAEVEGLGIATVYRNIKRLRQTGFIASVELPGEPPRYELAGKGHHHHFLCRECDRLYEVEGCPGSVRSVAPVGFHVEDHELVLYGLCGSCAA